MQVFQVYQGKIAVFSVSNEQIDRQFKLFEPIDVKIFAISRKIRHDQEFTAPGTIANGFHVPNVYRTAQLSIKVEEPWFE